LRKELDGLEKIARNSDSFMERLETTGVLKPDAAAAYGAVGLPARASGLDWDVRIGAPYAAYDKLATIVKVELSCDVYARFIMRFREVRESIRLIKEALATMPPGPLATSYVPRANSAIGYAESWRGEVLDWVKFDSEGRIARCVIRDPSFCNWPLFGELAPGNIVPDFPICNKSLNLSYSGTDL
jgi:Ni,Fe-hydrogenase III large subunit